MAYRRRVLGEAYPKRGGKEYGVYFREILSYQLELFINSLEGLTNYSRVTRQVIEY